MSDLNAIVVILATLITTTAVAVWAVDRIGTRVTEITTGVSLGIPISKRQRWAIAFQTLVPIGSSIGLLTLLNSIAMYQVANAVIAWPRGGRVLA